VPEQPANRRSQHVHDAQRHLWRSKIRVRHGNSC
jgi:hypothetical protein